ncbi:PepSY domain-containing protein [Sphingopyxis yananensis]|uniref:PepSY domain-containing protein n=1 Tax=Sphingopyxis yananensis TaxID=2886687 RepID=UPI001D12FE86|nr:PepSY domain-containing protein [Sphingopyxis yananensis]MCC2602354.1 PepSY domain-containing protein [Sphingopyxis yananensis]
MTQILTSSIALALLLASGAPASAVARDRDQQHLREAAAQGQVMPLNRIIADVRARAPYRDMNYLGGPQFDARQMVYALKFMDGSKVVVVYVDARTGQIVGRR